MASAGDPPSNAAAGTGEPPLHVVATAGHVDHGKSALILRLTGMDPDRLAEEKRRGLTIDLGFAWTALPSGREIGFVDVPGHERFIRNMLAGVGPVRLVLFVVAADEGWKPQSEEHLQILDVLGTDGAVVALTKRDLVDEEDLALREEEVRERLRETRLGGAPIVACSSQTGDGLDEVRTALDEMLASAPAPDTSGRPRQFVDRVFTIRGAGTVVTGTLTGGPLVVGQEAVVLPTGHRARIRGLQSHKRDLRTARPVSRVAVNLAGTATEALGRGDVLTLPGQWRSTSAFEGWIRPVRGLSHALTSRGAYQLYAGSAERAARVRLYGTNELRSGERAFVRVTVSRPVVVDVGDSFVLREAGRRETVAGGQVLDLAPPARAGVDALGRLERRQRSGRSDLPRLVVQDRGAVRAAEVLGLTGVDPARETTTGVVRLRSWIADPVFLESVRQALTRLLDAHHAEHPIREGLDVSEVRTALAGEGGRGAAALREPSFVDEVLDHLVAEGTIARSSNAVRLPGHRAATEGREDAARLIAAVAAGEPTPPSVRELAAAGFGHELVRAVCAEGRLVRVSADIVVTPGFLGAAEATVRELAGRGGVTVSAFREAIGTSRKYALPILEHFDAKGLTRRQGDLRILRG